MTLSSFPRSWSYLGRSLTLTSTPTMKTTIQDEEGNDIPVCVDYKYWPSSPGPRDKYGAPEAPDDPEELEVLSVTHAETGEELTLTKAQAELIEERCWENVYLREDE